MPLSSSTFSFPPNEGSQSLSYPQTPSQQGYSLEEQGSMPMSSFGSLSQFSTLAGRDEYETGRSRYTWNRKQPSGRHQPKAPGDGVARTGLGTRCS